MKKILIVEDDQIVANIYRNKFNLEGYEVEVALDGATGLELVRSFRPDAVILDLILPKMTGVELMKSIRAEPDLQQLPVIVFSNTYLSNMVQEAWKAGATKCLSKANCTPKQVIDVIRSVCGGGAPAPTAKVAAPTTATITTPHNGSSHHAHTETLVVAPAPAPNEADIAFQAELRKVFFEGLPVAVAGLRNSLQALVKSDDEPARIRHIQDLYRKVRSLTANAGVANVPPVAQVSDAVEALVKDLLEKPKNVNASTLRTIASAFDFVHSLAERGSTGLRSHVAPPNVLVVDDEAISRRAISYALEKAKLKALEVSDPTEACTLLAEQNFDLVFLDVDMPGMNGFELCTKLRTLPGYKKTPVVFVTSLNDLESRANSTVSGGNDFIAKPFLFMELAVKALVYIIRARTEPVRLGMN